MPFQLPPFTRKPLARLRWLARTHTLLLTMWLAAVGMLTWATVADHTHTARWALMLALVAMALSVARAAQWVVQRMVHIVALWEEDVPLDNVMPLHSSGGEHRGDRARQA
jgi:hypothetical protein